MEYPAFRLFSFYFVFLQNNDVDIQYLHYVLMYIFHNRELYSNNITGPIPSDLGNLTSLVSLDLYLNSFTGPIPDSLGKLSKLRFL